MLGKIRLLRQVPPKQSVRVFFRSPLSRTPRITEVDVYVGGDEALLGEAVQSESGRGGGDAKRGPGFSAGEVVSSTGGKVVDQGDRSRRDMFRFHSRKLLFFDALSKQKSKIGP